MTALGLIETKGLLAAIEGADAMLKAADVRLLEKSLASGGLVTITVSGNVAAVRAAVDAGVGAIGRIGGSVLVSSHVIARPDPSLSRIVRTAPSSPEEGEGAGESGAVCDGDLSGEPSCPEEAAGRLGESAETAERPAGGERRARPEAAQLRKMNVTRLRQLARSMKTFSMGPGEIASSRKKELIEALMNAYSQEEE